MSSILFQQIEKKEILLKYITYNVFRNKKISWDFLLFVYHHNVVFFLLILNQVLSGYVNGITYIHNYWNSYVGFVVQVNSCGNKEKGLILLFLFLLTSHAQNWSYFKRRRVPFGFLRIEYPKLSSGWPASNR